MSHAVAIAAAAASASPWLLDQLLGPPAPAPVVEPDRTTTPQTDPHAPNYWRPAYRAARTLAGAGILGIVPQADSSLSGCYAQVRAGLKALRGELAGAAGVPRSSVADVLTLTDHWLAVWRFGFNVDAGATFRIVEPSAGGLNVDTQNYAFARASVGDTDLPALTELGTSVCGLAQLRVRLHFALTGWLPGGESAKVALITDAWNACAAVAVDLETAGIIRTPSFDWVGRAGYWLSHPSEGLAKTGGAAVDAAADLVTGTFGGLVGDILFSTPVLVAVGAYVAWRVTQ